MRSLELLKAQLELLAQESKKESCTPDQLVCLSIAMCQIARTIHLQEGHS